MARSFPLALKLSGKKCLVVGESPEAACRAAALADAGADVHVVAASPCPELLDLIRERRLTHHARPYQAADMNGAWLAVLADRELELAALIARDADAARVFFCAVDIPEHGSFAHMAIARSGAVSVAITTEGRAPALGRRLREELQRVMDAAGLERFVEELATLRARTPAASRKSVLTRAVSRVHFDGCLRLEPERGA
jgi:siroheme synthase-like protein